VADPTDLAQRIRADVAERGLRPGDRLPSERALAERLGVSRTALREATRRLVDLGIVEPRRGAGTYLSGPDLEELMVVRRSLEPLAAELAAHRADEAERGRLTELLAKLRAALPRPRRFAELDLEFHRSVAVASHNRVLLKCLDDLEEMLSASRARTAGDPSTRRATLAHLERLTAEVIAGHADGAAQAMRTHLDRVGSPNPE
jgi:DNA-binding FadR family transcriptional regulator